MKTYTMLIFFSGKGEPIGSAAGFVKSRATGRVLALDPMLRIDVEGSLQAPAGDARFETVVMVQDDRTWESGRVDFPGIDSHLNVDTVVPGRFSVREDGLSTGSISWRVTGGSGHFEGATGIVTGNFVGHPDGTFTDHQLFKLVLPA
ncbi:hypothetical protein VAR608DRAFT_4173 [Variovorax sp. HW608]|uniref:hypothetical protein n=1 Tax=Variovorax sp. HW608 TaxID=1034889 RepID=UPI00081F8F27|nr:hypothetical protein [Variovorax sp. HW608]SCK43283.1 hypothetical protein VAR608DRAFT_4173 [Variovorax sp. HW608]